MTGDHFYIGELIAEVEHLAITAEHAVLTAARFVSFRNFLLASGKAAQSVATIADIAGTIGIVFPPAAIVASDMREAAMILTALHGVTQGAVSFAQLIGIGAPAAPAPSQPAPAPAAPQPAPEGVEMIDLAAAGGLLIAASKIEDQRQLMTDALRLYELYKKGAAAKTAQADPANSADLQANIEAASRMAAVANALVKDHNQLVNIQKLIPSL